MRHYNNTFIALSIPLMMLISCNGRDDIPDKPLPDMDSPIAFDIGDATKGYRPIDDIETLARQSFGVFAGYTPKGELFSSKSFADNYLKNMKIEYDTDDGSWNPSTPSYWPILGSLSFFGYAPYFDKKDFFTMPSADYTGGMLRGTYTPDPNVTSQIDLCLSTPKLDRTSDDGPVPMDFKHTLTRVFFHMTGSGVENSLYKFRVTDIAIKGVVGTNTFTYVMDEDVPFEWDPIRETTTRDGEYHLTYNMIPSQLTDNWLTLIDPSSAESDIGTYIKVNSTDNGRLYLLPQRLTSDASIEVVITVYTKSGADWVPISVLPFATYSLPMDVAWEPGKTVSYRITLNIPEMRIVNLTAYLTDWEDSGNHSDNYFLD